MVRLPNPAIESAGRQAAAQISQQCYMQTYFISITIFEIPPRAAFANGMEVMPEAGTA